MDLISSARHAGFLLQWYRCSQWQSLRQRKFLETAATQQAGKGREHLLQAHFDRWEDILEAQYLLSKKLFCGSVMISDDPWWLRQLPLYLELEFAIGSCDSSRQVTKKHAKDRHKGRHFAAQNVTNQALGFDRKKDIYGRETYPRVTNSHLLEIWPWFSHSWCRNLGSLIWVYYLCWITFPSKTGWWYLKNHASTSSPESLENKSVTYSHTTDHQPDFFSTKLDENTWGKFVVLTRQPKTIPPKGLATKVIPNPSHTATAEPWKKFTSATLNDKKKGRRKNWTGFA